MTSKLAKYSRFFSILLIFALEGGCLYAQDFEIIGKKCASTSGCGADSLLFVDTDKDATAWIWNFGDGSLPRTTQSVRHIYQSAGTYTVSLTRVKNGTTQAPIQENITVDAPPQMPAFRNLQGQVITDTTVCGSSLKLDPYLIAPNNLKYKWFPAGDTTATLTVKKSGCYSVEVKRGECILSALINVNFCLEQGGGQGGNGLQWFFGNEAGIQFKQTVQPVPPTAKQAQESGSLFEPVQQTQVVGTTAEAVTTSKLNAPEGVSVVVSPDGSVLFYTDGVNIYDKNHVNMSPAGILSGSKNNTQVSIIPRSRCQACTYYEYYTFVNDGGKFSYNIVDMRENGGNGGVTERNIALGQNIAEGMTATANQDSTGYFIITHEVGSNRFKIVSVDSSGINVKTQNIGTTLQGNRQSQNTIKVFASGKKVAMLIPAEDGQDSFLEIYDFDATKGELKNPTRINLGKTPPVPYSFEVSPNGKRLYVSFQGDPTKNISSEIRQYNLAPRPAQSIEQSMVVIDKSNKHIFGAIQLAPSEENGGDGKMYIAIQGGDSLAVVTNPDTMGRAIAYFRDGVYLNGKKSGLGLPNIIFPKANSQGQGVSVNYMGGCAGKPTIFTVQPPCGNLPKLYNWDFGDGEKLGPLPNIKFAAHTYKTPGKYVIKLRIRVKKDLIPIDVGGIAVSVLEALFAETCKDTTIVDTLIVIAKPEKPDLGSTKKSCKGGTVELSTAVRADQYVWVKEDNGTIVGRTNRIRVSESGVYKLLVFNQFCSEESSVRVAFIDKPDFAVQTNNPTGCTTKDGSILIRILGPPDTYEYKWYRAGQEIKNEKTAELKNLEAGNYMVDILPTKTCDTTLRLTLNPVVNPLDLKTDRTQNANCAKTDGGAVFLSILKGIPQNYVWRDDKGNTVGSKQNLENVPRGRYNVEISDAGGCKFSLNNIVVGFDAGALRLNLGNDATICRGETIELDAGAAENYTWNTGENTQKIKVTQSGDYSVRVSGKDPACNGSDNIKLNFVSAPTVNLPKEVVFCKSIVGSVTIDPKATGNRLQYQWLPYNQSTAKITVSSPGDYILKITNQEGCTLQRNVAVLDKCDAGLYIPDAFTPNGDNINDDLVIYGANTTGFQLYLYNRWGELLYTSTDPDQRWDGSYKNQPCPAGVYAYLIRYQSKDFPDKGFFTKRGNVFLLR